MSSKKQKQASKPDLKKGPSVTDQITKEIKFSATIPHEYLFLFIGLTMGLIMIFINPPWHSNDEDRHFINAYALSNGRFIPDVYGGTLGHPMPIGLIKEIKSAQAIPFENGVRISREELINKSNATNFESEDSICEATNYTIIPISYLPAAIAIKIGSVFTQNPIWIGWWARLGSLVAYLSIIFIAVRTIPIYKNLLIAFALTPMAIYQGASVSYDHLAIALMFLLFALVVKFIIQEKQISVRQLIVFAIVAWLQSSCKQGYAPLYLSILCVAIAKFRMRYALFGMLAVLAALVWSTHHFWDSYLASQKFPQLKFQSDFTYDGALSIKYYLHHPYVLVTNMVKNILNQGQDWLIGFVGKFGYSYTSLPSGIALLHICALIGISIYEGQEFRRYQRTRLRLLIVGIIALLLLITAALLFRSPVGAERIFGFQGRYLIPLIPFVWPFIFYWPNVNFKINGWRYIVSIYCFLLLVYGLYYINYKFYS